MSSEKLSVLIVAPLDFAVSGNSTTAKRLAKLIGGAASSFSVTVENFGKQHASSNNSVLPPTLRYDIVIGLHALRTARWLIDNEAAFLIDALGHQLPEVPSDVNFAKSEIIAPKPPKMKHNHEVGDERGDQRRRLTGEEESPDPPPPRLFRDPPPPLQSSPLASNLADGSDSPAPAREVVVASLPPVPLPFYFHRPDLTSPKQNPQQVAANRALRNSKRSLRPFILIFGGTDVNENAKNPRERQLMQVAVDRAVKCVCFSPAVLAAARAAFPSVSAEKKFVIIPQTVDEAVWATCNRLMRQINFGGEGSVVKPFDHDSDRKRLLMELHRKKGVNMNLVSADESEIDRVLREAQDDIYSKLGYNAAPLEVALVSSRKASPQNRALSPAYQRVFEQIQEASPPAPLPASPQPQPSMYPRWEPDCPLFRNHVRRWIVMPAGVRPVKNQAPVLDMLVELNKLAMRRETESAACPSTKSSAARAKAEDMQTFREFMDDLAAAVPTGPAAYPETFLKLERKEADNTTERKDAADDDEGEIPEWGLLLIGPAIDQEYAALIETEISWYQDYHGSNAAIVWHRNGISTERLITLLYDDANSNISVVLNSSLSEGQPQAIMEAMVVTAIKRREEEQREMFGSERGRQRDGFLCAVTDCPGNLAVLDDSCGIVLPLSGQSSCDGGVWDHELAVKWARIIHDETFVPQRRAQRIKKRNAAAKRAVDTMQPLQESLMWLELLQSLY